jgi:hypothetical protein
VDPTDQRKPGLLDRCDCGNDFTMATGWAVWQDSAHEDVLVEIMNGLIPL